MRNLREVLVNEYGIDLTGWRLDSAQGISSDGLTIAGRGTNSAGQAEGWIVVLPEPSSIALLGATAVAMLRRRAGRRAAGRH